MSRMTGLDSSAPPGGWMFGARRSGWTLAMLVFGSLAFAQESAGPGFTTFCFPGTGSVIACPCNNPPTEVGRGCDNFGAGPSFSSKLTATGTPSVSASTVVLHVEGENNGSTTIFLQSPSSSSTGLVFGAGVRCITGSLKRLYTGVSSGGAISRPQPGIHPTIPERSAELGDPLSTGSVRFYMTYYRDPNAHAACSNPTSTFNASPAGRIVWQP